MIDEFMTALPQQGISPADEVYDFHGIAVFQSHFIVILARYDSTVQLDGDAVCTIFLVGQVSEQVLAGRSMSLPLIRTMRILLSLK